MIYESTTITKAEGTVSDIVLYDRLGTPCMRSRPAQYRDAKSPDQLLVREKFQALTNFGRQYLAAGHPCFSSIPSGRTRLNQFISLNKNNYITASNDYKWANMILSTGPLTQSIFGNLTRNASNNLRITWNVSYTQGLQATSPVQLYLWDTTTQTLIQVLNRTNSQAAGVFTGTNVYSVRKWAVYGIFSTSSYSVILSNATEIRTI